MTQKYESLSFWEGAGDIDDMDALLLSLSVRFRVASTGPNCLILFKLRSDCPSTLGIAKCGVWFVNPFRWPSFPVMPFTKFLIFSIVFVCLSVIKTNKSINQFMTLYSVPLNIKLLGFGTISNWQQVLLPIKSYNNSYHTQFYHRTMKQSKCSRHMPKLATLKRNRILSSLRNFNRKEMNWAYFNGWR